MVKVKICGIKSLEEALCSIEAGADALGFIFAPTSKRYLNPSEAQKIINKLPTYIIKIGVFVSETPEKVAKIVNYCSLDTIQLHGGEDLEQYDKIPAGKIKVISLTSSLIKSPSPINEFNKENLDQLCKLGQSNLSLTNSPSAILLDSLSQGKTGGTG